MPFVEAKCTNCGHTLKVDNSKDAAICEFCGSAFIVEKAINNFNTYNQYQIEYANIQMADERSVEKRLENAEVFFKKLNQPEKAKELFLSVTEDSPSDYRGWWGVARVLTNDFTLKKCNLYLFNDAKKCAESAITVAPENEAANLKEIWDRQEKALVKFIKTMETPISGIQNQINELNNELEEAKKYKEIACRNYNKAIINKSRTEKFVIVGFVAMAIAAVFATIYIEAAILIAVILVITLALIIAAYIVFPYKMKDADKAVDAYIKKQKDISKEISVQYRELNRAKQKLKNGNFSE